MFSVYPCSLYLTVLYYTTVVGDNFSIMKTTFHFNFLLFTSFPQITREALKFGDGDGSNLCRVKKVVVSSTFIKNKFRSGLTLVSSNDIRTIRIDNKKIKIFQKNHKEICKYSPLKNCFITFIIPWEIVSATKIKNKLDVIKINIYRSKP